MSEKGILSKSIASNISEAIIDKLGGTGYAPTEWSKNINLLGISSADIEEALSSITEDTSSSDKGLLSLSIASDMGAMLNKKYNTSRGFKPSEVSSAVSALIPLPEKTATGSIVTFSDGADDVPLKSCEVALSASLDGYSEINVVQMGKNLFNMADYSQIYTDRDGIDAYSYRYMIIHLKPNTTYTVSQNSGEAKSTPIILINSVLPVGGSNYLDLRTASGSKTYTTGDDGYLYIGSVNSYDDVAYTRLQECKVQIEYGSTAHDYEPYTAPTTYTASLGRTIYGGTADVVNGTGTDRYIKYVIDGVNVYGYLTGSNNMNIMPYGLFIDGTINKWLCDTITASGTNFGYNSNQGFIFIRQVGWSSLSGVTDAETFNEYCQEHPITLILPLATPTDFTFEPVEINSRLGANTMWSEQGNMEVIYRADLDLYETPSMLLEANNTETEGNEEQEVNE
jgi:hypothetical protein